MAEGWKLASLKEEGRGRKGSYSWGLRYEEEIKNKEESISQFIDLFNWQLHYELKLGSTWKYKPTFGLGTKERMLIQSVLLFCTGKKIKPTKNPSN